MKNVLSSAQLNSSTGLQAVSMAKGITSGYFPLSAIAIGGELYEALERGSDRVGMLAHAGTYAAHPVGAAVAIKMLGP